MADNDLKQIRSIIREELQPIKKILEDHTGILEDHTQKLEGLTDQLADVSGDVAEIKNKLDSQAKRIADIENRVGLPTL